MTDLLILDDDESISRVIAATAVRAQLTPRIVNSSSEFRQAFDRKAPDAITLDLSLGLSDGIAEIRFLADRRYSNPLILISGFNDRVLSAAAEFARGTGLNVTDVLGKPFDVPGLMLALGNLQHDPAFISPATIEAAIADGEMVVEYQPIIDSRTRRLHKLEALVRWQHPSLGRLLPGRFLRLVEQSDRLTHALTELTVRLVAADHEFRQSIGCDVPVAVNVSGRALNDPHLPESLEHWLEGSAMTLRELCLEITETATFANALQAAEVLSRLRLKGSSLALDDFGTGFSSLKLLRQMPFSVLKIDQFFVRELASDKVAQGIVHAIGNIAAVLGVETVAEGVETGETVGMLAQLGIGYCQGFWVARPQSLPGLATWARAESAVEQARARSPEMAILH